MQKRLDYFYKSYDIDSDNAWERKTIGCMNEYGYNFDSNKKRIIDYEKKCSKVLYSDVKKRNIKGKR
ncbi:MAG: hypothetical protein IJN03_03605 [Bacilli bacterium]|nr:hypothetical protein [Bacilli bacterium]